jgi:hypothetical protein
VSYWHSSILELASEKVEARHGKRKEMHGRGGQLEQFSAIVLELLI